MTTAEFIESEVNSGSEATAAVAAEATNIQETEVGSAAVVEVGVKSKGVPDDIQSKVNGDEASAVENIKELKSQVLKQVEYYFSDANLPTDLWLLKELHATQGWLKIVRLCNFNNMKKLTTDVAFIAAALKASKELLEVSCDNIKVRRRGYPYALNERRRKGIHAVQKTIYVKGYPKDLKDIEDTVKKDFRGYGTIQHVKLRNKNEGGNINFKGSVYVEFVDTESARRARFNTDGLKYGEEPLVIYTKEEYMNRKYQEYIDKNEKVWPINRIQLPPPPPRGSRRDHDRDGTPRRGDRARGSRSNGNYFRLRVTNLPRGTSWQDLKTLFRRAGKVRFAKVERAGDGVVEFSNREDMDNAIREFDSSEFRESRIYVQEDSSPRCSSSHRQDRDRSPRERSPSSRRDKSCDKD